MKRLLLMVAPVLVVAAGAAFVFGRSDWVDKDPGAIVILSETELGIATNWFCNPQRLVEESRTDDEIRVSFQRLRNPQGVKLCGIGDCGWGMNGSANPFEDNVLTDLNAEYCQEPYSLAEPIGTRRIIVNGDPVESLDARLGQ